MEAAAEKSRSATVLDLQAWTYYNYTRLPAGGIYYPVCMFPTNSERLIGISDAFSAFVYGYPSSCPRAHCTPNKSVPTLRYTRRHGPVYIQAMSVGTYRVQSLGFPKIVYLGDILCLFYSALPSVIYYIFCLHNVAFVRSGVLVDCESLKRVDFIPLFVCSTHVFP